MDNQSVTDLTYLREVTMNDTEIIIETVETFIDDLPHSLERIKAHYDNQNWEQLSREAHKIKPNLQYMGMERAHKIILVVEKQAKTEHISKELSTQIPKFIDLGERAADELRSKLAELKSA